MSDGKIRSAQDIAEERAKQEAPPAPQMVSIDASELEKLRAKAAERDALNDRYLRTVAEFENYQKRAKREQERYQNESLRGILLDQVHVLDNIDMSLGALAAKGDKLTAAEKQLSDALLIVRDQILGMLAKYDAKTIDVKKGDAFDPLIHEAVGVEEVAGLARDEVAAVARRGFRLGTTILRATAVFVKKATASASS